MMKNLRYACFLICILFLVSCQESEGKGTLKISLKQAASKSIEPDSTFSRIAKYSVSGTGPGNRSFSKESSSKTITIEGLENGTWDVVANALSSNSAVLASGSKKIHFSGALASETINLNNQTGNGALSIKTVWNNTISKPSLEIRIKGIFSDFSNSFSYEISEGETSYTSTIKNLPAGFYLINVFLLNDGTKIGGFCETAHIVNSATTSGTVSFKNDASYSSSISLQTSESYTLSGAISGISKSLETDKSYTANFTISSSMISSDRLFVQWYIDGKADGEQQQITQTVTPHTFKAEKGRHFINAVVFSSDSLNAASACFVYNGFSDNQNGSALLLSCFKPKSTSKIKLDSSTIVGCLPDNKFIILSPSSNTMQICHLENSVLILDSNGTYTGTMDGFQFIANATKLYSTTDSYHFAILEGNTTLHILKFNPKKQSVEKATRAKDDSVVTYKSSFPVYSSPFTEISEVSIYGNNELGCTIFFTNSSNNEIFFLRCTDSSVATEGYSFKKENLTSCSCLAADSSNIIYFSSGKFVNAYTKNSVVSSYWGEYSTDDIGILKKILFINPSNILAVNSEKIKRLQLRDEPGNMGCLSDVNITVSDATLTPDGAYMYACNNEGLVYSYVTDYIGNFKILDSLSVNENLKQIVADNKNVISVASDGSLFIFEISMEEE